MTTDPSSNVGDLVTLTIKVDGKVLPDTYDVLSVETASEINSVPTATIVLLDGDVVKADFPISNARTLLPGASIEISAGYGSKNKPVFSGVIVKQSIEIDPAHGSTLVVSATAKALKMTLERKNAIFEASKDSDIINSLIEASGLSHSVAATSVVHEQIVQYYASDWDMMLTRAQLNGSVVSVDDAKVTVAPPDTTSTPVLEVTYGQSIRSFNATMDATNQLTKSAIKSSSWDPAAQKVIEKGPGTVSVNEPGNLSSTQLAKVFDIDKSTQQTGASINSQSLTEWSSSELQTSRLAKIQGSVSFPGSALAKIGDTLKLDGVGRRFNGNVYISAVRHTLAAGDWTTSCNFGLPPDWIAADRDIAAPEAAGLLPPIQGLQTGIVQAVGNDPAGQFRVQVTMPLLQADDNTVWVRLGSLHASNKSGTVFYPEVGDEVIVGFMNNDPTNGVILGSVYSKKQPPPYPPNEANDTKAIVTRSNLQLTFDDEAQIVEIKTPKGQTITVDDKLGQIVLSDNNQNTVTLGKSGISLESAGDIELDAGGDIRLRAGANISNGAAASFSATGNASAELVAAGTCTVNGALVQIN